MDRTLCVRFDVDTTVCIHQGMPALMRLARELNVRFTFFCNMGRSVSWPAVISSRMNATRSAGPPKRKLGAPTKLGWSGLATTILLNPRVGAAHPGILREALHDGHEIGLHGGRNHSAWHHLARTWSVDRLSDEVQWGLRKLHNAGIRNVRSFASPGWTSPAALPEVLDRMDFDFICDTYGSGVMAPTPHPTATKLVDVPTNILGAGGVGYLEETFAMRLSRAANCERFRSHLEAAGPCATMYDHPCFAGNLGLPLLRDFVIVAQDLDYQILPIHLVQTAEQYA